MALSKDLISEFVKVTRDDTKASKETITYGTVTSITGDCVYVALDGAPKKEDGTPEVTPLSMTTDVDVNDRVIVMIKNHRAVITGNLTSPSARVKHVKVVEKQVVDTSDRIAEFDQLIADKISTTELAVVKADITMLAADQVTFKSTTTNNFKAVDADIKDLEADNVTIHETLEANKADIEHIKANSIGADQIEARFATIEKLDSVEASVETLVSTHAEFESATADSFRAVAADIQTLETGKLSTTDIEGKYANIDFTNIGKAAMEYFYATSGLIENVVVGDGTITGNLVGVTITGDLIEGNTVKADKLVIKGTDGLYYKLNTDGITTEAEQTDYNSLNGSIIKAKSITATKIDVKDLVAFDATIGGFKITDNSIYSGVKESVDNTTRGIYMDNDGQIAFGDASNFVKFYKAADGTYKLAISADTLTLGSDQSSVGDTIATAQSTADNAQSTANATETRMTEAEALIELLSECISMLVTDGSGASLMTQTANGWTFSTAEIQDLINNTSEGLNDLTHEVGDVSETVGVLQQAVDDLGEIAEYVTISTYEGEPCIELGEGDSEFKLRITNTRMMFMEGSSILAYFNNQSFYVKKAVVEEELQQGDFVWKVRSNGNLGLIWKGGI